MTMDWLEKYINEIDGIPRPDWNGIYEYVDKNLINTNQDELWNNIAKNWMNSLIDILSGNYKIHESDNFILVTTESERYTSNFLKFLESSHKKTLASLHGIASDEGFGKYVVIIFDDIDNYYSYMSYFYPEDGEYGLSSGVYLNEGYGHFAFPYQELSYAETIAAHELTHALLAHLPIPRWLDEGLAVSIEDIITSSSPLRMNNRLYSQHELFWGEEEIQEFWSGDAFYRTDEGQRLSYQLAQFAVDALSNEYETFIQFANKAHFSDGGESAANEVYEGSLGNLISNFFGEGNWFPNPERWPKHDTSN